MQHTLPLFLCLLLIVLCISSAVFHLTTPNSKRDAAMHDMYFSYKVAFPQKQILS